MNSFRCTGSTKYSKHWIRKHENSVSERWVRAEKSLFSHVFSYSPSEVAYQSLPRWNDFKMDRAEVFQPLRQIACHSAISRGGTK